MFSVIIPTRNRPGLFRTALESVLGQTGVEVEVVVVNDGSDPSFAAGYRALAEAHAGRARFYDLPVVLRGHGQSYALNYGAARARGEYLCFLDDDDEWTEPGYLALVQRALELGEGSVDLCLSDQQAYQEGRAVDRVVWIEDLRKRLPDGAPRDAAGVFEVTVPELLACRGFCHLNTIVIRRGFFDAIGGHDEGIRYVNDREFYLRAIDRAARIKYTGLVVSRHNMPDPKATNNISTAVGALQKLRLELVVLDKVVMGSVRPEVRAYGKLHKVFTLKKIAEGFAREGDIDRARFYAGEALMPGFNVRWMGYSLLLQVRQRLGLRPR